MRKYNPIVLMVFVPLTLVAQSDFGLGKTESFVSTVKVVDNPITSIGVKDANIKDISANDIVATSVVSAVPTNNASLDVEAPKIPNVAVNKLASETEVVLNLPGQGANSGTASMAAEETISVDFPDEDVRTVLRSVADLFDLNLVIPDSLQGRTSIKLRNITWDQVFEVVLEPLGYTFVEDRNIVRIKSIEELTAEPVDTRIFIANYARAEELKDSVLPLVDAAAGGSIQVDIRSNALVIKERPSRMGKIQEVIRSLDQPTQQVMIESKFVEVRDTDIKNIGINWASLSDFSLAIGAEAAAAGAAQTGLGGATAIYNRSDEEGEEKSEAAVLSAEQFEVVLSALDTKSDVELVSNPTVVTLNNTKAKIAIGERVPLPEYSFNAQTGERQLTGFEFIDIGVNLDVTPSVNDAGFINLNIIPEVSSTTENVTIEGTDIPIISSRRTESSITIKDGYTLAIGGLVQETIESDATKVPLLGDIPGIGRFFRSNRDSNISSNLIIFITAKTLDPDGSDYRDVIDPRVLNKMQILPSDLPGYEPSDDELQAIQRLEKLRYEAKLDEEVEGLQGEVDIFEEANKRIEIKEKKKSKKAKKSFKAVEESVEAEELVEVEELAEE